MHLHPHARIVCSTFAILCVAGFPARADLSIAKRATENVTCIGSSCVATAPDAVLNVDKLQSLLGKHSAVSVKAGPARSITIDSALTWTSNATLSLTARRALIVNRPVTVAGPGGVKIHTADDGLSFAPEASLSFWNLSSALTINKFGYTLVGDVKSIPHMTTASNFAFARDYDASRDSFIDTPILDFNGRLEGLGHTVSHFRLDVNDNTALIGTLNGTLRNLHLTHAVVTGGDTMGLAVGLNRGTIDHVSVEGTIRNGVGSGVQTGGLAGLNGGVIRNSSAKVDIPMGATAFTGGLVASNSGTISNSWSDGTVRGNMTWVDIKGGLVGYNAGTIENSYTLASTRFARGSRYDSAHGGMIGRTSYYSSSPSIVTASYAAGATAPQEPPVAASRGDHGKKQIGFAGGVVGLDGPDSTFQSTYWVVDSAKRTPKHAAGNVQNDPGMGGLTRAQLQSALPAGFDPKIWGQSPSINNGYPYLLGNPPQ